MLSLLPTSHLAHGHTAQAARSRKQTVAGTLAAATAVLWLGIEANWMLRRPPGEHQEPRDSLVAEKRSTYVIVASTLLAKATAAALLRHAPSHRMVGDRATTTLIALPGIWAGLALRRRAVTTLGRHHRATVDVRSGQPVIRTGPYRYVRHPAYAGGLLAFGCAGLALDHPPAALALTGPIIAGVLYRIHTEEAALATALGAEYRTYAANTARLIPGVW